MANITIWPSQPLDGDQWERNTWDIGTPITKEKLENLEEGIAVLATQMEALLREIEIDPSTIILNGTRLDTIQKWITAAEDGTYDFTKGDIASRLATHDDKFIAIINEIGGSISGSTYGGTSRIDSIATEVWGSNTTSGISRIDKNDNKIAALANELGGDTPDGTSTTYPTTTTRLDDLEKEIGGTRSVGNGYTNSRIDALESTTSTHTNELTAIKNELGGSISGSTYSGTTRLDSVITKASSIATEIWGTDTISGDSRIDKLTTELYGSNITNYNNISRLDTVDKAITAIKNEIGGTYVEDSGFTNSRIDAIETLNTMQDNRLTSLENRADNIETLNTTQNNKLDTLTTEIGSLKQKVGNGVIGTDSDISAAIRRLSDTVAGLDPTGSATAVSFLVSEVWGQSFSQDTDFTANSRIDDLETTTQNLGTQLSTLAAEQEELEQNFAETDAKIPIELYIATNSSASDTIMLDTAPRDKSIFFIAIPQGTLGINNLTLQTPNIQFNNILINQIYNGNGMKIKYSAGSLVSIYRNGTNAYAYNVPIVL